MFTFRIANFGILNSCGNGDLFRSSGMVMCELVELGSDVARSGIHSRMK